MLDTLLRRLQPFLGYVADKSRAGPGPVNIPLYSERALREALANALVHRDYQSHEPTRVSVFSNRLEIFSPGGLPQEISAESFKAGEADPRWRNPALAHWMERLEQVQYQGQGMATIIQEVRALTGIRPDIRVDAHSVTVVLPASRPNALAPVMGAEGKQEGVLAISFGFQSIAPAVRSGLPELGLGRTCNLTRASCAHNLKQDGWLKWPAVGASPRENRVNCRNSWGQATGSQGRYGRVIQCPKGSARFRD